MATVRRPEPTRAKPMIRRAPSTEQVDPVKQETSSAAGSRAQSTRPTSPTAAATSLPASKSRTDAHRAAVEVSDAQLVTVLTDAIGTAALCDVLAKNKSTISRWRSGNPIPDDSAQKLRSIYEIFSHLTSRESLETVRNWFIAINPELGTKSPISLLTEGKFAEVYAAADAFVAQH